MINRSVDRSIRFDSILYGSFEFLICGKLKYRVLLERERIRQAAVNKNVQ